MTRAETAMRAATPPPATAGRAAGETRAPGRVGPNAALQLAASARARGGDALARRIFDAAGAGALLARPPTEMIDERVARRLFEATLAEAPAAEAEALLRDAGRRTGAYVAANRVPRPAARLLRALPRRWASALLLRAIAANAWTFAGSGACRIRPFGPAGRPAAIEIADNPLATPGCPWHRAVFEELFQRLLGATPTLRCAACAAGPGRPPGLCRFDIAWEDR
ncbi:MAG: bacteriochlorophyll 4-vinyl reductase [Pseudomonadota bacterium]